MAGIFFCKNRRGRIDTQKNYYYDTCSNNAAAFRSFFRRRRCFRAKSISNYTSDTLLTGSKGNDFISNDNGYYISIAGGDGNDIQFKVGSGSITIQDGAKSEREVTILDSSGKEIESLSGNKYTTDGIISQDEGGEAGIVLTSTFRGTYTASAVAKVDGSQTKKGITIVGDKEGITLTGGKGKDTLISGEQVFEMTGGKGNDTLWGGYQNENFNDADTFEFWAGDGNDKIMDYNFAQGDMLQILDKNGVAERNYNKANFDGESLKLTVNGGGKITFENVTASSKFNINGETYRISENTLVKG